MAKVGFDQLEHDTEMRYQFAHFDLEDIISTTQNVELILLHGKRDLN